MTLFRARIVLGVSTIVGLGMAVGCSSSDEGGTQPVTCTGTTCSCAAGASCTFSQSGCSGGSCSLECKDKSQCSGTCGESCSITCSGGSSCNTTVGKSGSVSCTEGATCNVTCTADCSVTCGTDSTCTLKCSGDTEVRSIPQGGNC
ncbi:MAG: hypothetical protein R3B13_00480 [Polyangiaceae bacterium]